MLTVPRKTHHRSRAQLPQPAPAHVAIAVVPPQPVARRLLGQARHWLVALRYHFLTSCSIFKRIVDICFALFSLLLFLPLFALVALLIKATDGGPVLFWQKRVGRWGREFAFPKFRSMVPEAEDLLPKLLDKNDHGDAVVFKMKDDPRVTWIGRILRKFSIDELPQLWCVLKGEMSLVGPRPPIPREVAKYTMAARCRLNVLPGLTCIWQVSGRSTLPFEKQVELDIEYIENHSIWLDVKLLFLTIPAVLCGDGAY